MKTKIINAKIKTHPCFARINYTTKTPWVIYIDIPDIVNFINLARNKGAKIDNYYELNELIKGVYRDVE